MGLQQALTLCRNTRSLPAFSGEEAPRPSHTAPQPVKPFLLSRQARPPAPHARQRRLGVGPSCPFLRQPGRSSGPSRPKGGSGAAPVTRRRAQRLAAWLRKPEPRTAAGAPTRHATRDSGWGERGPTGRPPAFLAQLRPRTLPRYLSARRTRHVGY